MVLTQLIVKNLQSYVVIQLTLQGTPEEVQLTINEMCVKSSASLKYLGMILDQHLNNKLHIESIAKKIATSTGIFWKLRKFLPAKKTLLNLHNALIKSHLRYGLIIWRFFDPCTTQQPLQLLQNNATRAISMISRFEQITSSFR